ncbi:hypothetical protein CS542_10800 [Pedobacter sp. IW39]|nr:hypothetical protein CS542_10800 [Pedobacter sp. IW39]
MLNSCSFMGIYSLYEQTLLQPYLQIKNVCKIKQKSGGLRRCVNRKGFTDVFSTAFTEMFSLKKYPYCRCSFLLRLNTSRLRLGK